MKTRVRRLRMHEEIHTAEQYGFAYLAWYEQKLMKVYRKIIWVNRKKCRL